MQNRNDKHTPPTGQYDRRTGLAETSTTVYVDDHLIVANKPAGLLSVPGRTADKQDCLLARMQDCFPELYVVHRLDRDTSGAMIFARSPQTQSAFGRMFQQRQVEKQYCAWVEGHLEPSTGQIDAPIGRVGGATLPPRYRVDFQAGRPARHILVGDKNATKPHGAAAKPSDRSIPPVACPLSPFRSPDCWRSDLRST